MPRFESKPKFTHLRHGQFTISAAELYTFQDVLVIFSYSLHELTRDVTTTFHRFLRFHGK